MIIMPPRELIKYVTTDENGRWIAIADMPKELEEMFTDFVKKSEAADNYKKTFSEQN